MPALTFAVDLTYRDGISEVAGCERKEIPVSGLVLTYGDFDKLVEKMKNTDWKRRRAAGLPKYSVRFLVAGEYGPAKGRAHWHAIFFVRGVPGEDLSRFVKANRKVSREGVELGPGGYGERVHWYYWPHGFAWLKECGIAAIRYTVKYALKPESGSGEAVYGYSKKPNYSKFPPLGSEYFSGEARRLAAAGLAVHDNSYYFADIRGRDGKPWQFFLTHKSLELYLIAYVEEWARVWGGLPPLTPFLVETYFDPIAREEELSDPASLERKLERRRARDPLVWNRRVPAGSRDEGRKVVDVRHVATLLLSGGGVAAGYSDGTLSLGYGEGVPARRRCGADAGAVDAFCRELGLGPGEVARVGAWFRERVVPALDGAEVVRPLVDFWERER